MHTTKFKTGEDLTLTKSGNAQGPNRHIPELADSFTHYDFYPPSVNSVFREKETKAFQNAPEWTEARPGTP